MKQCSKCRQVKEDSLFSESRNQCKECKKQCWKQYRLSHKDKIKKYMKQYRLNCKDELKQYNKQYQKQYVPSHREEANQRAKQYYLDNKKKVKQQHLNRKDKIKKYMKKYCIDNNKQIKKTNKQYRLNNKEKIKKKRKQCQAKRRNMKYIPLLNNPFPKEINVDNHHILNNFYAIDVNNSWNKWFVIPIPKITHNFIAGSTNNLAHWIYNEIWIRKLYDINIKELLGQ